VTVCRWQTVEDGAPRDRVDFIKRHEGHVTENVKVGIEVRHDITHSVMRTRLVVRAYRADEEITAALMPWDEDDGA
jgi:hypothetical protein